MGISFNEWALRQQLWLRHGCPHVALYGDDGEMQCHHCMIDFLRDNVDDILKRFQQQDIRRREEFAKTKPVNDSVATIVEAWLKRNGYDGLYHADAECACKLGAIDPGDCLTASCQPGYYETCDDNCSGEHGGWHITSVKRKR